MIMRKCQWLYWEGLLKVSPQEQSTASNNERLVNMVIGEQETSCKKIVFVFGRMVLISKSEAMMRNNAFWSLLV